MQRSTVCVFAASIVIVLLCKWHQVNSPDYIWHRLPQYQVVASELCGMNHDISTNEEFESVIASYRDTLRTTMETTLCISDEIMVARRPDDKLNRLAVDILLDVAQTEAHKRGLPRPTVALMNVGGLRDALPEGPITLGNVYKVSPFDNKIVILELDSAQMEETLQHLAERGGEALAGASLQISGGEAHDILVAGEQLSGKKTYILATVDYLAQGGDSFFSLTRTKSYNLDIVYHDALADYFMQLGKKGGHVTAPTDVRVVYK
ncbi:MAG: 5'-nucleotidase C-terminal domain-containing protein [Bacteroidales bacterium]|nr:5'-nucleotidase C-terminal domain-containing protein [Bacteroidales bacterium]